MVLLADVRPCLNCASKVVPVSICNACGVVASRPDLTEVDRRLECAKCKASNPTQFTCDNCNTRFLFEEVAGPQKEQFACLLCGTFVDADAKSCSACGAVYEEEAPKAPVLKKERPKRKIRGEFTDSEVEEIARIPGVGRAKAEALCAAGYSALWKIKRASEEELARVRQIGPKGAKAVKDSLKFILLLPRRKSKEEILGAELACPLCGCVTSLFSKACADCGAAFDEEEMDDELRREVRGEHEKGLLAFYDVHGEETPDDADLWYARALLLIDMGEFPEALKSIETATRLDPTSRRVMTVRSRVLASMQETTQSAEALRGSLTGLIRAAGGQQVQVLEEEAAVDPEVKATSEALESLSALAERECPTCGEPVVPDARVCPACGNKLEAVPSLRELAAQLLEEEPLADEAAAHEAVPEARAEPERAIEPAPSVPGISKREGEEEPEEESASEPEVAPEPVDRAVPRPAQRRPVEPSVSRERTLQAPQDRFRRGLINGHGLVNGRGRVNGLVNGLGFIDTSLMTELRIPARSLLFRYAVIGASLLLAFSISATIIPAPPIQAPSIAIDGNPQDWNAIPKYADPRSARDPNVAIQEYGVYQEGDSLSFLVQVSGQALGDPTGNDGFYMFFDTDGTPTTGYSVRGIGADFVAEVVGGSGTVTSALLFEFPPDSEMNWSRRAVLRGVAASVAGSYLEVRVPTDDFAGFSQTNSTILIAGDDFEGSVSRASVALGLAAFGAIRIEQVPLAGILSSGTTPALRLDVVAIGDVGTSGAWTVGPFTFAATSGLTVSPSSPQVTLTQASPTASVVVSVSGAGLPSGLPVSVSLQSAPAPRPVTVVGAGLEAYFLSVPAGIRIDGLFADWASLQVPDTDTVPIPRGSLDIRSYAGAANASGTYFMLNVAGPLYDGSFAPQRVPRTVSSGVGGASPPGPPTPRITGEDVTRVFIDSNATDSNGESIGGIYADYMVEVRGTAGAITATTSYAWQSGWVLAPSLAVSVEKNESAMEGSLGLSPAQLNGTRMVFETSDWSGSGEATNVLVTRSSGPGDPRTRSLSSPGLLGNPAGVQLLLAPPLGSEPTVDGLCSDSTYADGDSYVQSNMTLKAGTFGGFAYICIQATLDTTDDGSADFAYIHFDRDDSGGSAPTGGDRRFKVDGSNASSPYRGTGSGWEACPTADPPGAAECHAQNSMKTAFATYRYYEFKIHYLDVWNTTSPSDTQRAGFAVLVFDSSGSTWYRWGSDSVEVDTLNPDTWGHLDAPEFALLLPVAGVVLLFLAWSRRRGFPRKSSR